MKLMGDTFEKYQNASKLLIIDNGIEILLPLMLTIKLKGAFNCYQSMPLGVYGSLVSSENNLTDEIFQIFNELKESNLFIVENSFSNYDLPISDKNPMETQILRLGNGVEKIWKNFRKGHRWAINKAIKLGISIDIARKLEDYKEYYNIYQY